jgi:hypothetical protein
MHFFIWCFLTASRHWSNLCLGFWIAWLLSFPCSLVSKWHIFYAWHFGRSHPSVLHFRLSILLASRLPSFGIFKLIALFLRIHTLTVNSASILGQVQDHLAFWRQIWSTFGYHTRSGRSFQAVNPVHLRMQLPVPAEALKLWIRYICGCNYPFRQKLSSCESGTSPDATTRSGSSQAVNTVHLRIYYPFRFKLSNCKSGTRSDTTTYAGRSYWAADPVHLRIQLPVRTEASEHDQSKFKHLTSFIIY